MGKRVEVVRDVNSDGSYQADQELGVAGIEVAAYGASGDPVKALTDAAGRAVLDAEPGSYRVEATIPESMPYLKPAPAHGPDPALSPLTTFVDAAAGPARVTMGVHNPADYAEADPPLATPVNFGMYETGKNPGKRALVRWSYDRRGFEPRPETIATHGEIGATYGLAWQRSAKSLYAGALAKRLTSYGPSGHGGIYRVTDGKAEPFVVVPDAGSTEHGPRAEGTVGADPGFWDVPGKEGLGDLDISENDKTLYTVNLNTRELVRVDLASREIAGSHPIPNPGCASRDEWRPFGLGVRDGVVHVGGVCSGADLKAHVLSFDPGPAEFDTFFSHDLTFKRGGHNAVPEERRWHPWLDRWDTGKIAFLDPNALSPFLGVDKPSFAYHAQPILSDVVFDRDGSMILGFRDRFGDDERYVRKVTGKDA